MYLNCQLTDVTLFVDNKPFKAHKMVLSACSLFFRDMFLTDQTSTVVLKDVTEKQMRMLLKYFYTGK